MIHITTDILKAKQILENEELVGPYRNRLLWKYLYSEKPFKKYLKQKKTPI
jgi:hypothetical protein